MATVHRERHASRAAGGAGLARVFIAPLIAYGPGGVLRLANDARRRGVAFAVVIAVISSIVFGLVPAWRTAKIDINTTLKQAARGAGGRSGRDFVRSSLIAGEVALALVLLVSAGLLIRSGIEAQRVSPGFNPRGVFSARFSLPEGKYSSAAAVLQATQAIEAETAAIPGVRSAAVSSIVPGVGTFSNGLIPEEETRESRNIRQSMARFVSPRYFDAMGLPVLKGRSFNDTDRTGAPLVIVINDLSWGFLIAPVGAGALLLALFAYAWHNVVARGPNKGDIWPTRWW